MSPNNAPRFWFGSQADGDGNGLRPFCMGGGGGAAGGGREAGVSGEEMLEPEELLIRYLINIQKILIKK